MDGIKGAVPLECLGEDQDAELGWNVFLGENDPMDPPLLLP